MAKQKAYVHTYKRKGAGLTPAEEKEFRQLKIDLLEYHQLDCTHYNAKKVRYDELWDKNAEGVLEALKFYEDLHKQIDQN